MVPIHSGTGLSKWSHPATSSASRNVIGACEIVLDKKMKKAKFTIEIGRTLLKPPAIIDRKVWRESKKGRKVYSRKGKRARGEP